MSRYLLAVYQPDAPAPPPAALDRIMRDVRTVQDEMKKAGAWVMTAGLHPPGRAKVVRSKAEDVLVTDGPFAETTEHIGGFTIVEAADVSAAVAWARKLAKATTLPIEVRPVHDER